MTISRKREKFIMLAEKRVSKAIKDLRLIGNLSNRNNYAYSDDDVKKIVSTLNNEIKNLKSRFTKEKQSNRINFKL